MKISRNQLIDMLKNQSKEKDEWLYEMLKDDTQIKPITNQEQNENTPQFRCCSSCRYDGGGKCKSDKFKNNWQKAITECIRQDHKYWEEKNE